MPEIFNTIPIGRIDPNFDAQLLELKTSNASIYQSTTGLGQRTWQMPNATSCTPEWDFDLFNITGLANPFERTNENLLYARALIKGSPVGVDAQEESIPSGEGRISDCQVEKIQVDYLASQERSFRMRHASSVRCSMHAAIRRKGNSTLSDVGMVQTVTNGTINYNSGPVGGVFTTMIRYLMLLANGGYNDGGEQLNTPGPQVVFNPDGTVSAIA